MIGPKHPRKGTFQYWRKTKIIKTQRKKHPRWGKSKNGTTKERSRGKKGLEGSVGDEEHTFRDIGKRIVEIAVINVGDELPNQTGGSCHRNIRGQNSRGARKDRKTGCNTRGPTVRQIKSPISTFLFHNLIWTTSVWQMNERRGKNQKRALIQHRRKRLGEAKLHSGEVQ